MVCNLEGWAINRLFTVCRSKFHRLKHGTDLVFADMKPPVAEPSESELSKLKSLSSSLSLSLLPLHPSFFSIIRLLSNILPTSLSLISFLPPYLPRFPFPPPYSSYLHCRMSHGRLTVTCIDVCHVVSHPSSPLLHVKWISLYCKMCVCDGGPRYSHPQMLQWT